MSGPRRERARWRKVTPPAVELPVAENGQQHALRGTADVAEDKRRGEYASMIEYLCTTSPASSDLGSTLDQAADPLNHKPVVGPADERGQVPRATRLSARMNNQ